jgi:putative NADH-flavin reductase
MNILLLGATGRVGKVVTGIIIGNGHQLTVLVRDKNKVKLQSEYLYVVEGDIYDWALLKKLSARGYDVIINVIGTDRLKQSTLAIDTAIAISSLFVFIEKPIRYIAITGTAQMRKTIFGHLYTWLSKLTPRKHHIKDHQGAFDIIKTSELDWCLIACPNINDGPRRGRFKTAAIFNGGKKKIYPGDAALAIYNQINQHDSKKVIGIWY